MRKHILQGLVLILRCDSQQVYIIFQIAFFLFLNEFCLLLLHIKHIIVKMQDKTMFSSEKGYLQIISVKDQAVNMFAFACHMVSHNCSEKVTKSICKIMNTVVFQQKVICKLIHHS